MWCFIMLGDPGAATQNVINALAKYLRSLQVDRKLKKITKKLRCRIFSETMRKYKLFKERFVKRSKNFEQKLPGKK